MLGSSAALRETMRALFNNFDQVMEWTAGSTFCLQARGNEICLQLTAAVSRTVMVRSTLASSVLL